MQQEVEEITPEFSFGKLLRTLREANKLTLEQVGAHFGLKHQAVWKWEQDMTKPKSKSLPDLARLYKVPVEQLIAAMEGKAQSEALGESNALVHTVHNKSIDLPYVSFQGRSRFQSASGPMDAFGLSQSMSIIIQEGETYQNNILIEVRNDSMDPYYPDGTIVRAEWVDPTRWPFMPPGVYAVFYNNYFVFKRLKSNELLLQGHLVLHSDNPQGGSITIPREQLHHAFQVKSIVHAPAR